MPKPPEGMSEKEYVYGYCPNYIMKHESGNKDKGYLINKCQALWNKYKATSELANTLIADGYIPVSFSYSELKFTKLDNGKISMSEMKETTKNGRKYTTVDAIVAVGDRFYGRVFVGSDVLKKTTNGWNNTYNDLSHLATAYPAGLTAIENLEYITGYNTDAYFDNSINGIRLKMHINHNAPKYNAWKNFVDISEDANRIPNVSIFGFAKYKAVKPDKLPKDIKMSDDKLINGYVIIMEDLIPFAVTTCIKGKCDDSAGCGICEASSKMDDKDLEKIEHSCKDGVCEKNEDLEKPKEEEKPKESEADKKHREYLVNRLKELNGEI